ncbi:MAG: DUF4124 domain-containing protein [Bdellovibrio bacteriovorus]
MNLSRTSVTKTIPWPLSAPPLLGAFLSLVAAPTLAAEVQQRVYECKEGGQVIFSDQPCGTQERQINLQYDQPSAAQATEAGAAARAAEAAADQAAETNLLDTEILNAEKALSQLETERDAAVAALRAQRDAGTEGLDQDAWVAQMNAKMESTYQDYTNEIINAHSRLNDLRARRAALDRPPGRQ